MKKNVLALSIAAMIGGFAGAASAQTFTAPSATKFEQSEGGVGHILVVPYFTTQNDNMSVFHVVNTDTVNGKALKVRFRGAANSDDILDFTVFLSPYDVWTGSVQADANGSYFMTADNSCTYPNIHGQKVSFVQDRLADGWTAEKRVNNTKEGYVEILNMADVTPGSDLFKTIKHAANGAPACADTVLERTLAINPTTETAAVGLGYNTPTGQLTGDWYILNVAQTTTFSGAATAIKAVDDAGANARGKFVAFPQDNAATGVAVGDYTADPLFKAGANIRFADGNQVNTPLVAAVNYDFPDLSTPYLTTTATPEAQASLLTQAVANNGVSNQFATDTLIQAKTDWVLSMPTRRYSVGANYAEATNSGKYRVFNTGVVAVDNTTNFFDAASTSVDADGNICVNTTSNVFYDREESSVRNGAVISPGTAKVIRLCGEVNVLAFKDTGTSVLGASVARQTAAVAYENGWGQVNYTRALPVVGSSFIKLTNSGGAANGFSGTYGITWPHRFSK
ncbi:cell surface protein [Comamonas squillarum]|uniref:Cell surface protein n=1 Tax=Comamonas squillarum TaxID=2977320 RepID=A0ABY5ZRP8_9BURK|nr:cell surface protein [Comamonas sp. PR12]UXC16660.1 cell surface protein [Comamonas sp. PR12]